MDGWKNTGKYNTYWQAKDEYSYPQTSYTSFGSKTHRFIFTFRYNGEQRMLRICVGCEYDVNSECNDVLPILTDSDATVWISLDMWGESSLYVKKVLESVKEFGDTYFLENDCSDKWEKY